MWLYMWFQLHVQCAVNACYYYPTVITTDSINSTAIEGVYLTNDHNYNVKFNLPHKMDDFKIL